jgi:aryl-alcohol dehydrogenase-like predicted oxidoreductase
MTQNQNPFTRREFIRTSSAAMAGAMLPAQPESVETGLSHSPILNFNPKMGYRRLGQTRIMISEIGLGGHSSGNLENRAVVLERAAELGINYLDTNVLEECALYGQALKGKRDDWIIGFDLRPTKITEAFEKHLSKRDLIPQIEARLRDYRTDTLDIWRPVGVTWGPLKETLSPGFMVSRRSLDTIVETFEKVRRQGKVKWLGISDHDPRVFRLILEHYPQFSVVIFPYLFLTKDSKGQSLLEMAKLKEVGVIGMKPFGGGSAFIAPPNDPEGKPDSYAHILLKKILIEPRLSSIIAGVNTIQQLEEDVIGSYERHRPIPDKESRILEQYIREYQTNLPPAYQWLRQWEIV